MNTYFHYQNQNLFVEQLPLSDIAAQYGTPCYVYSKQALTDQFQQFSQALANKPHLICYAVKANSNLAILNTFAQLGAGFDIVSGGELLRVIAAGGDPKKVVFSGVAKSHAEIKLALSHDILCFNVESAPELERINAIAGEMGKIAPISLRVNPNVDAKTHPYISTGLKQNKFGVAYEQAIEIYQRAQQLPNIKITGLDCHIGSQLTDTSPFVAAIEKVLVLVDHLSKLGIELEHLDLGGGLGICYKEETPPAIADYIFALLTALQGRSQKLILEPGRVLVGNAGVLLTSVEYIKQGEEKSFAIVDVAMNDLMRPALYDAYHGILPLQQQNEASALYDVVGPICETGDFVARGRELSITPTSQLAIMSAGAYGMTMSSNYNTRPRAAEIMVSGTQHQLIRARETVEALFANEQLFQEQK